MIKRLLSYQSRSITGAAVILGLASLFSRLIGILRDRLFAHSFGAGEILDAYHAAFRIPDTLYTLIIVGAISAGFIPVLTELLQKDKKEAKRVTRSLATLSSLVLFLGCGALFFLSPWLVQIMTPGFDKQTLELTIVLTRVMLASPVILGLSAIVSGILQTYRAFFVFALTPIMYNLGIILGNLVLVPRIGPVGLAYGVVLGALLHLCIQIPSFYHYGFSLRLSLEIWQTAIKKIVKLMIPRTLGLAAAQLNFVAITVFSSTLNTGSLAIFHFANNLQSLPVGMIGVSFALATFPALSTCIVKNDKEQFITSLAISIRQILFFIIPLTVLFILLRAQIVRVVLGSGAFDWNDTIQTADTLRLFALSLFAQSLIPILARAFFALEDTWTPFLTTVIGTLVTVLLAHWYVSHFGILGIALAFSIGMVVQCILLWFSLRHKLGTLHEHSLIIFLTKVSIAALPMALVTQKLKEPLAAIVDMQRFWGIFTQGLVAGLSGIFVFLVVCQCLRLEELQEFHGALKKRWFRQKPLPFDIPQEDITS